MTPELLAKFNAAQQLFSQGNTQKSLEICDEILNENNSLFDPWLLKSIVYQKTGQLELAIKCINRAIELNSTSEIAQTVKIQIFKQANKLTEAITLCHDFLSSFPQNAQIWYEKSQLEYKTGNKEDADYSFKQHLICSASSPLLGQAMESFFKNDFFASEKAVRQHLASSPNDVSALRLLGEVALNLGVYEDAQRLFERALQLAPKYHLARLNYAHVLNKREQSKAALTQITLLEKHQPDHPPVLSIKAAVLVKLGSYQQAISIYKHLLSQQPNQPETWASLGHTYKTTGDKDCAVEAYLNALKYNPDYGDAYWSLANLKTYQFTTEQVNNMLKSYDKLQARQSENEAQICFALGKAYESTKDVDDSFKYYSLGNQIKGSLEPYNQLETEELVRRNIDFFNHSPTDRLENTHDITPIFIVGLPRSGSTLLEQILASHSLVDGTKELPDIVALARKLGNRQKIQDEDQYPQSLAALSAQQKLALGQQYIESSMHLRNGAPYFIDKMPNNFLHIGLIKTILPHAKIVDARRLPISSGFSCFKQLFATGQNFSYDLNNIHHYYQEYLKIMEHWKALFPDDIITVQYEDVIADTEQQVRSLLNFLDLAYEENCLQFHRNKRAVATASAEQVRQPINSTGLNAWQPFKQYLSILQSI